MKRYIRQVVFATVSFLLIGVFSYSLQAQSSGKATKSNPKKILTVANASPKSDEVIDHGYYCLNYDSWLHNPVWVSYLLTRSMVRQKNAQRRNCFRKDSKAVDCPSPKEYSKSGYDKGHICPAGDMAWDQDAQDRTFLMSNMTPQEPAFNRGIWKKLEEKVRDWAEQNDSIIVIAGPIFCAHYQTIGRDIAVPVKFYKIVIDISYPTYKAIGFVLPNRGSNKSIYAYSMSIDQVEKLTGLNFFPAYDKDNFIQKIEKTMTLGQWQR